MPSSPLETSGDRVTAEQLAALKGHPRVLGLAEMMNFPGVLNGDQEVMEKLDVFKGSPLDGHAPFMRGRDLCGYIAAGIRTDHECTELEEAQEKLSKGMRVLIREGSVAKNAHALFPLLNEFSSAFISFCTDDRNPLDISVEGHIDYIVRCAIASGIPAEVVFRSASMSTAQHYRLHDLGAVAPGYVADLVILDDVQSVSIHQVVKRGQLVGHDGWSWGMTPKSPRENSMNIAELSVDALQLRASGERARVNVIEVIPGQIITGRGTAELPVENGRVQPADGLLKMAVLERHHGTGNVGVAFTRGFGFHEGAIASSVAHDAHNLGVVGASDEAMIAAAAAVRDMGGGIAVVNGSGRVLAELPLPVAGLMSDKDFDTQVVELRALHAAARGIGGVLDEPFLQLSFLALPVIPTLKLSDLGLVDVDAFEVISAVA
ncbi:MAG: adenine deaminase C-terminal domain-containing protein [Myxococcota bacterium]